MRCCARSFQVETKRAGQRHGRSQSVSADVDSIVKVGGRPSRDRHDPNLAGTSCGRWIYCSAKDCAANRALVRVRTVDESLNDRRASVRSSYLLRPITATKVGDSLALREFSRKSERHCPTAHFWRGSPRCVDRHDIQSPSTHRSGESKVMDVAGGDRSKNIALICRRLDGPQIKTRLTQCFGQGFCIARKVFQGNEIAVVALTEKKQRNVSDPCEEIGVGPGQIWPVSGIRINNRHALQYAGPMWQSEKSRANDCHCDWPLFATRMS